LEIKSACGTTSLIDLDAPRAALAGKQGDLRYHNACSSDGPQLGLGPGARAAAVVADADTDAPGCADQVKNSALEAGETVPVQKGAVLCVLTGTPPVLALVEVTALGAKGALSLRATAWSGTRAAPSAADGADVPSDEATPGD
jgi:hypothetical protein